MNGVNPATFYLLPMLGKHPDEYPRFRDCFIEDGKIRVYTRTGGGNREEYEVQNQELRDMPTFIRDWDDEEDCTYAYFEFSVPEEWQADFDKFMSSEFNLSPEYLAQLKKVYPKLADKFEESFGGK